MLQLIKDDIGAYLRAPLGHQDSHKPLLSLTLSVSPRGIDSAELTSASEAGKLGPQKTRTVVSRVRAMARQHAPLQFFLRISQAAILLGCVVAQTGGLFSECGGCALNESRSPNNAESEGGAKSQTTSPLSVASTAPPTTTTSEPPTSPISTSSELAGTSLTSFGSGIPASTSSNSDTLAPENTSVGTQTYPPPVAGIRKSSVAAGTIAGIVIGIIAFLMLMVFIMAYTRGHFRRRRGRILARWRPMYLESTAGNGPTLPVAGSASQTDGRVGTRLKSFLAQAAASTIRSHGPAERQEYLRNRILAAQRELAALNDGSSPFSSDTKSSGDDVQDGSEQVGQLNEGVQERTEVMQERIRMLEAQLQSQWAFGLTDEPPPGYFE
ncbi:hypothetical protein B0H17DRAFT_1130736 [Mycena rosella]|uniref:Uncharacterized protein n=1 Tax=Mycena rosella TaxID=1033263 RepID=A0AAD7GLL3_MYCRO|nr:hypothetical protein B0H17DRAFT_1130736 [Mycena rosella]